MGVARVIAFGVLAVVTLGPVWTRADRLYGNVSISMEHVRQTTDSTRTDDVNRELAIINYEDALFTKNLLRLTANLQRRKFTFTDYHEFQPIYMLDLSSYGYSISARYSPYTRRSLTFGEEEFTDVYHRDWRVLTRVDYPKWPAINFVFSRERAYDKREDRRTDTYNRNVVLEGSYNYQPFSFRANYNNLLQARRQPNDTRIKTRTYSGTVGINEPVRRLGYFSTTYNYYHSRRYNADVESQRSNTQSVSAMAVFSAISRVTATASYSGRFLEVRRSIYESSSNTQNMSAGVDYIPVGYLVLQGSKGYQISTQSGDNDIIEYISLGATVTRYLRNGVDTRLAYNRTIFQQSLRLQTVRDSSGAVIATYNKGDYALDTYHGSFNFSPRPYMRAYIDVTLLHDSDPVDPNRRYQLTRSIDARFNFTRKLEGRFTFTALSQGDKLRFDRAFSNSYNAGLTYTPQSNINMNLTYIYSRYSGVYRNTRSSLTGYVSYSFRRAFTAYVSVNRQTQNQETLLVDSGILSVETKPLTTNAQILIYLSERATLSIGYLKSKADQTFGPDVINESVQGVLNIQL